MTTGMLHRPPTGVRGHPCGEPEDREETEMGSPTLANQADDELGTR